MPVSTECAAALLSVRYPSIQLFRERFFGKMCMHGTIPKGIVGYDQYTVPDTVAVELTFVAFL